MLFYREAELVNKYHYAFNYFKKPIEVKQYHSPNLKKAYDTKKEVKPEPAPKPRKVKVSYSWSSSSSYHNSVMTFGCYQLVLVMPQLVELKRFIR